MVFVLGTEEWRINRIMLFIRTNDIFNFVWHVLTSYIFVLSLYMPLFKVVSKLVQKPTTSASHVDTKDTGVTNAGLDTGPSKEGQVHTEVITTPTKQSGK